LKCQNEKVLVKLNTIISKQKALEEKLGEFDELKDLIKNSNNNNNNNDLDNAFITV
jgi:hypothetical protein